MELPGVEPLSPQAWARVHSAVVDDLDHRRAAGMAPIDAPRPRTVGRRVAMVGVVAAAVAVAVLAGRQWLTAPGSETWHVVTADESSLIELEDAEIRVAAHSSVKVEVEPAGEAKVDLERGAVECNVEPRAGRRRFSVRAGDVVVSVVGTRFTVARRDSGVHVAVARGVVLVRADGASYRVGAGEAWPAAVARASDAPEEPTLPEDAAVRDNTARSDRAGSTGVGQPDVGQRPNDSESERGPVEPARPPRVDDPERPPQPALARGKTPTPPVSSGNASGDEASGELVTEDSGEGSTSVSTKRKPRERKHRKRLTPAQQRKLFARAQKLSARDPKGALALFHRVAQGDGTWAALALYAEADLALQGGQLARAKSLLRAYLRRFPRGPNADDARRNLEQIE